jgi:hypothetical protein
MKWKDRLRRCGKPQSDGRGNNLDSTRREKTQRCAVLDQMTTHPCTDPRTGKGGHRGFLQNGPVWLTTVPFQPSLRLTDFEVAATLQLAYLSRRTGGPLHQLR